MLYSIFIVSYIIFLPNIVHFMIQALSCREISRIKYVQADLTIVCYSKDHLYTIYVCIFTFFVWIFLFPYYLYQKLIKIKYPFFITTQYKYGFLYQEYNQKALYWELIKIYMKILIILSANILRYQPITQFLCIVIILFGYYIFIAYKNPYITKIGRAHV